LKVEPTLIIIQT